MTGENLPEPDEAGQGKQRKQARMAAALALAVGETVAKAAKKAGISERTVYRWSQQSSFRNRVAELRARLVSEAVGKLSKSMASAAGVLDKLLKSEDEGTRLRAARAVLELTTKLRESEELERRITELERRAKP